MFGPLHPLRRGFPLLTLAVGMGLAAGVHESFAHETGPGETRHRRTEARLERAGFELVGAPRRKGDFLIVTATRESISWRIVVDQRSGEIVGQRPIGYAPQVAD